MPFSFLTKHKKRHGHRTGEGAQDEEQPCKNRTQNEEVLPLEAAVRAKRKKQMEGGKTRTKAAASASVSLEQFVSTMSPLIDLEKVLPAFSLHPVRRFSKNEIFTRSRSFRAR